MREMTRRMRMVVLSLFGGVVSVFCGTRSFVRDLPDHAL
jgi:hypothetical protein